MLLHPNAFLKAIYIARQRARPVVPLYHAATVNTCPDCGGGHWHIGRVTAECAHCSAALPLALLAPQPSGPRIRFQGSRTAEAA